VGVRQGHARGTAAAVAAGLALAAISGVACGASDEEEIRPGTVTLGVVAAPGEREQLVLRGVQVAAAKINGFGGIGGAAPIALVVGTIDQLLERRIGLFVLPCEQRHALAASRKIQERNRIAVAPCDDGGLPRLSRVFPTGLSPDAQADVLARELTEPAGLAPPATRRGRVVARLLAERIRVGGARLTAGTDAPEVVRPPLDAPEGAVYVTYGFPEAGNRLDEFYERYKAMFGHRPRSVVAALAGDAADVLARAIEDAASVEPLEVAHQIRHEGVEAGSALGTVEFPGRTLRARTPWVALRVERGRYVVVDSAD
jgi:ABC-type branched-subunit amino acid transport system substrate-binding protein